MSSKFLLTEFALVDLLLDENGLHPWWINLSPFALTHDAAIFDISYSKDVTDQVFVHPMLSGRTFSFAWTKPSRKLVRRQSVSPTRSSVLGDTMGAITKRCRRSPRSTVRLALSHMLGLADRKRYALEEDT